MKRLYSVYIFSVIFILFSAFSASPVRADEQPGKVFELKENWTLQCSDSVAARLGTNYIPATVPGNVHQDLLNRGLIPDPYAGANESQVQWVEEHSWIYSTTFSMPKGLEGGDEILLRFAGLDTYSEIYLNNQYLGSTRNMFLEYVFPVMKLLKPTDNVLTVKFQPAVKHDLPRVVEDGFIWPADNDHSDYKTSVYTRKAPYSFGWDWGIRLVGAGIWRPVTLERVNGISLENVRVKTMNVSSRHADLNVDIEAMALKTKDATFSITLKSPNGKQMNYIKTVRADKGTHVYSFEIEVDDPFIWQPNGMGKQFLYEISVRVQGDAIRDEMSDRFGIRHIQLVQNPEVDGETFYFEVNGRKVYAKGANLIPGDALLSRMNENRYREIIDAAVEQNMNMLRVWGGGIYEDDALYRYADEAGIMIWQDFMFGCTAYPSDPDFLENVRDEVRYNVKRLRNHPCIALWCGNNEVEEALKYWGWQRKYAVSIGAYEYMVSSYDKLFKEIIPNELLKHDDRQYIHTSPLKANWGRPDSWSYGDAHNWGLWYGEKPFESFDRDRFRFVSEFGFQSYPEMKTIRYFAGEEDMSTQSAVMTAHQKASTGNALIGKYMSRYYKAPSTFEDTVYVSLVMQGEGMYRSIMAQRRNRPYCMGSLYWQLNDSWPVVSWSSIDYFGNRKALHYYAGKAFEPLAVDVHMKDSSFDVNLISDLPEDIMNCDVRVSIKDFSGTEIYRVVNNSIFKGDAVTLAATVDFSSIQNFETIRNSSYVEVEVLDSNQETVARAHAFFSVPKDLQLHKDPELYISYTRNGEDDYSMTISSPTLVKNLYIDIPVHGVRYSDNFFDLLPDEQKVVRILLPGLEKAEKEKVVKAASEDVMVDELTEVNVPEMPFNQSNEPVRKAFDVESLVKINYINKV